MNLDYTHKKVVFRRAQVYLRLGSVDAAQRDLEAVRSAYAKNDPEIAKELALLELRQKEQSDKQKKTFSGTHLRATPTVAARVATLALAH